MAAVVVMLTVLAFVVRIAYQLAVGYYDHPVVWEYGLIADNIVSGHGYVIDFLGTTWSTLASPAYPLLIAALEAVSGGPGRFALVGIVQAASSAALVPLSYVLAVSLAVPRAASVAAAVVAFHPALIVYVASVHEFTFDALVTLVVLIMALAYTRVPTPRRLVGLALIGSVAGLTRPTIGAFALLCTAALARVTERRRRILVVVAVVLMMNLAWPLRNILVLPSGSGSAYTCVFLWVANNPAATTGGHITPDGGNVLGSMDAELRSRVIGKSEAEQGRALCESAFSFIRADPLGAIGRWLQRFVTFWWSTAVAGALYPPSWIALYRPAYAFEAVLAVAGAVVLWRRRQRAGLGFVFLELASVSTTQSFFLVEGRHRLMLEPTIAVLSATGFLAMIDQARARLQRSRTRHTSGSTDEAV